MKTIERRAILASEGYCDKEFSSGFCAGYQEGARKQRQIDIEKACQWFESYLAEIGYPDDWCRDSEVQESGEKRFRKFMEE